jgi:hypothetical protein
MNNQKSEPTLRDVVEALEKSQETLEEIVGWLRLDGADKVKKLLEGTLDSQEKILMYYLSDGKSNKVIGDMCGVDPKTVSNNCRTWHRLGLMKSQPLQEGKYKYYKNFNLEDFGIKIPELKSVSKQTQEHTQTKEVTTQ